MHRGLKGPTKGQLLLWTHRWHWAYERIAKKYGVDASAVQHWLRKHGIPKHSRYDTRTKGRHSRLPDRETLHRLYLTDEKSAREIAEEFSVHAITIRRLCHKYGIRMRPDGFQNQRRYKARDGTLVRSVYERRVADWLHSNGLAYEYEPKVPFKERCRADFKVGDCFIEIWGVHSNKRYAAKKAWKRQQYKAHGCRLVELGIHAFAYRSKKLWSRILVKSFISKVWLPV